MARIKVHMMGTNTVPNVKNLDKKYEKSGVWKCSDSPTGAHHSKEVSREGRYGLFVCKYCQHVQKLPLDYEKALGGLYMGTKNPVADTRLL